MPATLEPPPIKAPVSRVATHRPRGERSWTERLTRSAYFLGAVLLHLLIFAAVATWVVFQPPRPPATDPMMGYVRSRVVPPPPPPSAPHPAIPMGGSVVPGIRAIVTPAGVARFLPALPSPAMRLHATPALPGPAAGPTRLDRDPLSRRLPGILRFIEKGQNRPLENIQTTDNDAHKYVGTFPVYLASYADGDWGCNVVLKNGAIVAGSLPDLVSKINEWSHGNMKGTVVPAPLDIGGPDLLAKCPPFIFFTGHKDFILTEKEVGNLRAYLQDGGCIWGDNALPGYGSRFDVAFRREMRRVLPDKNLRFEDVPLTSGIFQSWFNLTELARGMNYYDEPVQHLDLDRRLAILYTPNDYSDLLFMNILPGDTDMGPTWTFPGSSALFTNPSFLGNSNLFFRNFTFPAALDSHRLGMNIVAYLLVRFDNDLILVP